MKTWKIFKKWKREKKEMSIEEEIVKALCDVVKKAERDAIMVIVAIIGAGITVGLIGVRSGIDIELLRSIGFLGGISGALTMLLVRIPVKFIWDKIDTTFALYKRWRHISDIIDIDVLPTAVVIAFLFAVFCTALLSGASL